MIDAPPPGNDARDDALADETAAGPSTGRVLSGTGFENDTGEADPNLMAALADESDDVGWLAVVAGARLLVPIVAAPTGGDSADLMPQRSTNMAVVTLTSPDGQRALPVFSSLAALLAWDATARPSPVTGAVAARAAVSEGCDVLVLDVRSGHPRVLRPSMVWALAQQRDWLPAHTDPFVAQALSRATADEADVIDCHGEEAAPLAPAFSGSS